MTGIIVEIEWSYMAILMCLASGTSTVTNLLWQENWIHSSWHSKSNVFQIMHKLRSHYFLLLAKIYDILYQLVIFLFEKSPIGITFILYI